MFDYVKVETSEELSSQPVTGGCLSQDTVRNVGGANAIQIRAAHRRRSKADVVLPTLVDGGRRRKIGPERGHYPHNVVCTYVMHYWGR